MLFLNHEMTGKPTGDVSFMMNGRFLQSENLGSTY